MGPCSGSGSKGQLQRELDLSGRTEIARREPRRGDLSERAGYHVVRVAKVGVIENVEQLCPELQVELFRDLRVFDDGEVRIHEVWSL